MTTLVKDTSPEISPEFIETMFANLTNDVAYKAARNAVADHDVLDIVKNRDVIQNMSHTYSNQISKEGKCTSQKSSGRCWMFALCNVIRIGMMKKYKLPNDFELSQSFLFFYDKLERGNYFLTSIIETRDQPTSSRLISHLCTDPTCDGGQFDMLVNIVEKYGIVPKSVYPDTKCCVASRRMNLFLKNKLRTYACELRKLAKSSTDITVDDLFKKKNEMMVEYHRILAIFFGKPPTKSFDFKFRDKDGKFKVYKSLTPIAFYERFGKPSFDVSTNISLINDPRNEYYKLYTVEYLGNVIGGKAVRYINLPIDELRKAAKQTIDQDLPVWFGCDVGKSEDRQKGLLDANLYDFKSIFGTGFTMNKMERLLYGESLMTHAMVFTAYDNLNVEDVGLDEEETDVDNNKSADEKDEEETKKDASKKSKNATITDGVDAIRAWRVENSWGTARGDNGYLCMTNEWFGEFVYQVVVDKNLLNEKIVDVLKQEPIKLPAWDPMGALA